MSNPFDGLIDEFQIWAVELSIQEIQNYMNCSPIGNESDLIVYWGFEDNTDPSFVIDQSGNGYDGTINGGAFYTSETISLCQISGCTNATACNYDSTATVDDGSCILPDGCTDALACNYDSTAICDDGLCTYPGCTYPTACNYDPLAGCDDGYCIYQDGCMDSTACNYNPLAICDDGLCSGLLGCTDTSACNYNPLATCDDSTCHYLWGCTFSYACAYCLQLVGFGS